MTMDPRTIAEAFSGHRFADAYEHLAPDVRWVSVGGGVVEGKDAVVATCESTLAELAGATTEFTRFVSTGDDEVAAVDAIGRYTGSDGGTTVVSSCDIYEFHDRSITRINSYVVELDDE